jgi:hypothetical protein
MAINAAEKFASKTSDLLYTERKTQLVTNQDYDFDGVETVKVYTLTDPTIGNYDPSGGANRYGNPTEVEDTVQTFTLSRDRAWTKTIDKSNYQDTQMIRKPAKYLAQATRNVLVPEIDTYIIAAICTAAATANRDDIVSDAATTASNAYTNITDIVADIIDNDGPSEGLIGLATPQYVAKLKQSSLFDSTDIGLKDRKAGVVGMVDNVKIVKVPSSRFPANTDLVITHPMVTIAPEKLIDYTLHQNPQGVSGQLLEYRHRYDAFIDTNKINAVGVHKTA